MRKRRLVAPESAAPLPRVTWGKLALADPKTRRQVDRGSLALADAVLKSADVSRDDEGNAHRVRLTFAITAGSIAYAPR